MTQVRRGMKRNMNRSRAKTGRQRRGGFLYGPSGSATHNNRGGSISTYNRERAQRKKDKYDAAGNLIR